MMAKQDSRALGLVGLTWAACLGLTRLAWLPGTRLAALPHTLATTSPVRTLPLVLSVIGAALAGWLFLVMVATVTSRSPGGAGRAAGAALQRVAPASLRRLAELALGATTVLAVTAGGAQAATPTSAPSSMARPAVVSQPAPVAAARSLAAGLDRHSSSTAGTEKVTARQPLREGPPTTLDRPATRPPTGPVTKPATRPDTEPGRGIALVTGAPTRSAPEQSDPVRVRPGDSLWRIAARSLAPGAGSDAIEAAWHRWYAANRAVIGPDPAVIQPGQLLTPPAT